MPWPTPQEYNEAIQNPAHNFADPELVAGTVETTALGLPRPITGNFASVYRMRCAGRDWAVRCFWREYADMRERYAAISAHLRSHPLPYTVGFDYLPQGIRVRGSWYPVLKMEWIEGELLGIYIERHLGKPATLSALADRWREMVLGLEAAGVAHGDLQHGNVLVVNDSLRLVDYDALYVPALRGKGSHELGHQHYQHPGRTERHFGPQLDRFASLVIECSLRAVASRPELWTTLQAGDESLLFRRGDFADPAGSPAFRLLLTQPDSEVVRLAGLIQSALSVDPLAVPSSAVMPGPARSHARSLATPIHMLFGTGMRAAAASPAAGSAQGPAWLADHLPARSHPRPGPRAKQSAAACVILGAAWLIAGLTARWALPAAWAGAWAGIVAAALSLLVAFHGESDVRAMRRRLREERRLRRALAALDREIERYERRRTRLRTRFAAYERRRQERLCRLADLEQRDLTLTRELERAHRAEAKEHFAQITRTEQQRVQAALEDVQRRYTRARLRRHSIRSAPLPVVIKLRLWLLGARNAARVDAERMVVINRLGGDIAEVVAAWRVDAEFEARRGLPTVLPATQLQRITEHFGHERARHEHAHERDLTRNREVRTAIAAHWARRRRPIELRLERRERTLDLICSELDAAVGDARRRAEPLQVHLARARRDLEPYADLSFGRYLAGAVARRHSMYP